MLVGGLISILAISAHHQYSLSHQYSCLSHQISSPVLDREPCRVGGAAVDGALGRDQELFRAVTGRL